MDKFSWKRFIEVMSKKYKRFSDFERMLDDFKDEIMDYVGKSETYFIDCSSWDFHLLISNLSLAERRYIWRFTDVLVEKDVSIPDLYAPVDYLYNVPILSTPDDIIKTSDKLNELLFYSIFLAEDEKTTWGQIAEHIKDNDAIEYLTETQIDRRCLISIDKAKEELNEDIKRLFEKFKKYL